MKTQELEKAKELLISVLIAVGKIQKSCFQKTHAIELKESISSIVTEVDLICDKIAADSISSQFPLHNILSEESGLNYKNSRYTWVIDPLDGTSNFAAGIPWFGVMIALFDNNLPLLAGAYLTMEDLLFFAESGNGAFMNNKRLQIENAELKNSLCSISIDYTEDTAFLEQGLAFFKFIVKNARGLRSTNSLFDFIMVADGRFGCAVNLNTKIWDIAAFWLIIKEAGGVLKHLSGDEIVFDLSEKSAFINYPVILGSLSAVDEFDSLYDIR